MQGGGDKDQGMNAKADHSEYATSLPGVFAASDMRRGQSLHMQHHGGRRCKTVPAAAAAIVIRNEAVAPAGDTLFPDFCPAQTWRIIQ